jgi:tRNA uridine 5-carbamoylmethylation protein Kti12
MPLVVIVGSACTGKTTRCKELKEYLQGLGKKVEVICDPDDKNGAYRG